MRTYDNGSFFTVTYSANDAYAFRRRWPGATVEGRGAFEFDKRNGDLIGARGSAATGDGSDWLAFSEDLQRYGERKLGISTGHFRSNPGKRYTSPAAKRARRVLRCASFGRKLKKTGAKPAARGLRACRTRKR